MHKLKFESDGHFCDTECHMNNSAMVGSRACKECNNFIAVNTETNIVVCDADFKCPNCGILYNSMGALGKCIEICSCKHTWGYSVYSISDGEFELDRRCEKCGKMEDRFFDENDLSQKVMTEIWEN